MTDTPYFTCPLCGSHYFGREVVGDENLGAVVLETVRCHGDSSGGPRVCGWRGVWPPVESEDSP